jgi:hypothetical protein
VFPELDVPELNTSFPLAPPVDPAFLVEIVIAPLEVAVPAPALMVTAPPVWAVPVPAVKVTAPPALVAVVAPAVMTTLDPAV